MWTLRVRLAVLAATIAPLIFFAVTTEFERRVFIMHVARLAPISLPIVAGAVVGFLSWNYQRFLKVAGISASVLLILTGVYWWQTGIAPSGFEKWGESDWLFFGVSLLLWAATFWAAQVVFRDVLRPLLHGQSAGNQAKAREVSSEERSALSQDPTQNLGSARSRNATSVVAHDEAETNPVPEEVDQKYAMLLKYSDAARALEARLSELPADMRHRFKQEVVSAPSHIQEIGDSLLAEYKKRLSPFGNAQLNELYQRLSPMGPDAQAEFKRVIEFLEGQVDPEKVFAQISKEFSGKSEVYWREKLESILPNESILIHGLVVWKLQALDGRIYYSGLREYSSVEDLLSDYGPPQM